jgi:MinD superfamily P-loop ATPase
VKLAIVSGKGGTGKTLLAVNLVWSAPQPADLLDCDVEEPNCHLFLGKRTLRREPVSKPVPVLLPGRCTGCGLCARICQFKAVAFFGKEPLIFPDLCHGCGGCIWVCPAAALRERGEEIGEVEVFETSHGLLFQGRLRVGQAQAPPLIRAVKRLSDPNRLMVLDGPPGADCSLAAAIADCDLALLVAEPTSFGRYDLELALSAVQRLGLRCAVIVNRAGRGRADLRAECARWGVEVLAEIPESEEIARAAARGRIALELVPSLQPIFAGIWSQALALMRDGRSERRTLRHANV